MERLFSGYGPSRPEKYKLLKQVAQIFMLPSSVAVIPISQLNTYGFVKGPYDWLIKEGENLNLIHKIVNLTY